MMEILLERVAAVSKRLSVGQGLVLVAVGAALLVGTNLGATPLLDPDEAKHAEIAREMLVRGRWIEPIVNFEPYHHKPSLLYLLVGASYRLLGTSEVAARLIPALGCWLTLIVVYLYGARRSVASGLAAATLLSACGFFIQVGRFTNFDALMTMTMTVAVLAFATWLEERERRGMLAVFYVFVALSVLIKGPVAIVLVVAPVAFSLWRGGIALRELRPLGGTVIIAAIVSSWAIPTWSVAPDYLWNFLWVHNVGRYFVATDPFHPEAFYFFIPILAASLLPWSVLAARAVQVGLSSDRAEGFLAAYAIWVVVFFSLSAGKLATYVLPAFPALAVLVAAWGETVGRRDPAALRWAASFAALLAVLMPAVAYLVLRIEAPAEQHAALVFVPASLSGVLVLVAGRRRLPGTMSAMLVLCAGMMSTVMVLNVAAPAMVGRFTSDRDLALAALDHGRPRHMIAFEIQPYSFLFYTGWPMTYEVSDDEYRRVLAEEGPALLLTKDGRLKKLGAMVPDLSLEELARNQRHVLFLVR